MVLMGTIISLGGIIMSWIGIGVIKYGGKLNKTAMETNGGFMPVYNPTIEVTGHHIPFWYKEDVNNFLIENITTVYQKKN